MEIREVEERAAAARLGVHDVVFLRFPDGELQPTLPLRRQLARLIRLKHPDIVVTNDPTARWYGTSTSITRIIARLAMPRSTPCSRRRAIT